MILMLLMLVPLGPSWASPRIQAPALEEVASKSTGLVQGRVVAAVTRDIDFEIRTVYTVRVEHVLLGTAPPTLQVELPGGRTRGTLAAATGVPVWTSGDQVLVFIQERGTVSLDGVFTVRGGVVEDAQNRPITAFPDTIDEIRDRAIRTLRPVVR